MIHLQEDLLLPFQDFMEDLCIRDKGRRHLFPTVIWKGIEPTAAPGYLCLERPRTTNLTHRCHKVIFSIHRVFEVIL